jgi:hypothetical protein
MTKVFTKEEFINLLKQQVPGYVEQAGAEQLEKDYQEALRQVESFQKPSTQPEDTASDEADNPESRTTLLIATAGLSVLLRVVLLAFVTGGLNRTRHVFNREEKFRFRDVYVLYATGQLVRGLVSTENYLGERARAMLEKK